MKKMMTSTILLLVPTILTIGVLSACGSAKSSNPLSKYEGMKTEPANDNKPTTQSIAGSDLFSIQVAGANSMNTANFIEGETSQVIVKIKPKSGAISNFSVSLIGFDNSAGPELAETAVAGEYSLTWSPSLGTIPGGALSKMFSAQIQAAVSESSDPRLVGLVNIETIPVIVGRNNSQPVIKGWTKLTSGIDEGQEVSFTVDVLDPALTSGDKRTPQVVFAPFESVNTEAFRANGSNYIFPDRNNPKPVKVGDVYRFFFVIKADQLPLDRDRLGHDIAASASVDLCFMMSARSVVKTVSDEIEVCAKARYAAQPPTIAFDNTMPTEVKAGESVTLHVKISSEHPASVISIAKYNAIVASLGGQNEVSCEPEAPDKKNSQICVIKWTPACVSSTVSKIISVRADSTLGKKTKSAVATKDINVVPTETCVVEKPVVKKPMRSPKRTK